MASEIRVESASNGPRNRSTTSLAGASPVTLMFNTWIGKPGKARGVASATTCGCQDAQQ